MLSQQTTELERKAARPEQHPSNALRQPRVRGLNLQSKELAIDPAQREVAAHVPEARMTRGSPHLSRRQQTSISKQKKEE